MPNLNKVMLMGHMTRDCEVRVSQSGMQIGKFGLAINRRVPTKDGGGKEETCFVDCTSFGKTAELISEYVKKGDPLFVEGRLHLNEWVDRETNAKRTKLEVVVENMQFVSTRGGKEKAAAPKAKAPPKQPEAEAEEPNFDDIPF